MEGVWDKKAREELQCFLADVGRLYQGLLRNEEEQKVRNFKKIFHIQQVIRELEQRRTSFEIKSYVPKTKPVCEGLKPKAEKKVPGVLREGEKILEFFLNHQGKLCWQHGYESLPKALEKNFAFGEVLGAEAPIPPKNITLGFVLLSPGTHYPKHVHQGVDELYINIGASCEINGVKVPPGGSYYVFSGAPHGVQVSEKEMGILMYTWTFPKGAPGNYEMRFVEEKPRGQTLEV